MKTFDVHVDDTYGVVSWLVGDEYGVPIYAEAQIKLREKAGPLNFITLSVSIGEHGIRGPGHSVVEPSAVYARRHAITAVNNRIKHFLADPEKYETDPEYGHADQAD